MSREASVLVKRIAEPRPIGDKVKAAIGRATQRLGWAYSRTYEIWYGRARRIEPDELESLRRATAQAVDTTKRLRALRNALAVVDPAFHRESIDALDWALGRLGGDAGPGRVRGSEVAADGEGSRPTD